MWATEPSEPDLADNSLGDFSAQRDSDLVPLVLAVELNHAAVGRPYHLDAHPLPIPDLEQTHATCLQVAPLLLFDRPAALHVPTHRQVGTGSAVRGERVEVEPFPTAADRVEQILVFWEHEQRQFQVGPLAPDEIAGVAQIGLFRQKIPKNLIAMDGAASVRVFERVAVPRNLDPTKADTDLAAERLAAGCVRFCVPLSLVELVVQRLGNLVAGLIVVRDHFPVGSLLDLQAQHSVDGRLYQRLDCRGNPQLSLTLQHLGVQLIAVVVIRLAIRTSPPCWLLLQLVQPGGERVQVDVLGLDRHQNALQFGGAAFRACGRALPAFRAPSQA